MEAFDAWPVVFEGVHAQVGRAGAQVGLFGFEQGEPFAQVRAGRPRRGGGRLLVRGVAVGVQRLVDCFAQCFGVDGLGASLRAFAAPQFDLFAGFERDHDVLAARVGVLLAGVHEPVDVPPIPVPSVDRGAFGQVDDHLVPVSPVAAVARVGADEPGGHAHGRPSVRRGRPRRAAPVRLGFGGRGCGPLRSLAHGDRQGGAFDRGGPVGGVPSAAQVEQGTLGRAHAGAGAHGGVPHVFGRAIRLVEAGAHQVDGLPGLRVERRGLVETDAAVQGFGVGEVTHGRGVGIPVAAGDPVGYGGVALGVPFDQVQAHAADSVVLHEP